MGAAAHPPHTIPVAGQDKQRDLRVSYIEALPLVRFIIIIIKIIIIIIIILIIIIITIRTIIREADD